MIYIHGTNHESQHTGTGSDPEGVIRLESFVKDFCVKMNISVVAEELSTEVCEISGVKSSVCYQIAHRMKLTHIYCDPVSSERAKLGVPSQEELANQVHHDLGVTSIIGEESNKYFEQLVAKYHGIREKFWMEKLGPHKADNILFICGSDHKDSFAALLTKHGMKVEIV